MKKYIISIFAVAATLFAGCDINEEYQNGPNAATFPASEDEVIAGLFSGYKNLSLIDASSTPYPGIQDNASDIGTARINSTSYGDQVLSQFTSSHAWAYKVYNYVYKGVGRVNLVLDNFDNVKSLMSEEDFYSYKAELLVLRSFHFDLANQFYGDAPYFEKTISLGETYSRMDREEMTTRLLDVDMADELIEYLPVRFSKDSYGTARIGRVAAYGLKARICLNWGLYEDAAKYAEKALALIDEAGYKLETFDTSLCGKDHTAGEPTANNLFGASGQSTSDENIWALQFNPMISSNQHNGLYYAAMRPVGGCSYFGPTQAFIDAIQCSDGKSIADSPLYDYQNPWSNRDPRLDLFCVRPGSRALGVEFQTNPSIQTVIDYNNGGISISNSEAYGTKSEYGANGSKGCGGYLWRKYLDIDGDFATNNKALGTGSICTLNYPLMRLAELYLIRAEAYIELNSNLDVAKSDIELIRTRAGMPTLTATTQSELRSALRYERMVELCNEGFRWFDIRRWGVAEAYVSGKLYAPALDGSPSNAKPTIDTNWHVTYSGDTWDSSSINLRTFVTMVYNPLKDGLWPIPEEEILAMPTVTQNPQY